MWYLKIQVLQSDLKKDQVLVCWDWPLGFSELMLFSIAAVLLMVGAPNRSCGSELLDGLWLR